MCLEICLGMGMSGSAALMALLPIRQTVCNPHFAVRSLDCRVCVNCHSKHTKACSLSVSLHSDSFHPLAPEIGSIRRPSEMNAYLSTLMSSFLFFVCPVAAVPVLAALPWSTQHPMGCLWFRFDFAVSSSGSGLSFLAGGEDLKVYGPKSDQVPLVKFPEFIFRQQFHPRQDSGADGIVPTSCMPKPHEYLDIAKTKSMISRP